MNAHKSRRVTISEGGGPRPFEVIGADRPGRWLVTCDHASNAVPAVIGGGGLGIGAQDMARHIAYDVGAAGLAIALAERLDSPVILGGFSRLVIDVNRGEDDPTLVMQLYDGTIIPANRGVSAGEVERRLATIYRPYHAAYALLLAQRPAAAVLAIHSFTPRLQGRAPRPWQVGVLYSHLDERLARPLLARLREVPGLCLGDNEPYAGHLPGDAIDRHCLASGRLNALIELRNDLIAGPADQMAWAALLTPILDAVLGEVLGPGPGEVLGPGPGKTLEASR